ncbi:persephin [Brachyhypopomus gauderio]|uniref:persephin n=1 Tax=Brachyhypopomus gauderio TaxID=698409 RepID=UPI0040412C00
MRSLLKLTMLLFCVQAGEGHWLHTLLVSDTQEQTSSSKSGLQEERSQDGGTREARGGTRRRLGGEGRERRSTEDLCALRTILLRVSDLGLGYDSDETVLFKYCSGTCPHLPSNHDLTLASLQHSGALRPAALGTHSPCCRPTRHEDMAFLDNTHRWHKVEKLSAAACTCLA